jgi:pilus assembly protein CpaB
VAWISSRPPVAEAKPAADAPPPPVSVIVAARVIHAGSLLRQEDLASKEIPRNELELDSTLDTPELRRGLSGAMVRRGFSAGEVVHSGDVMHPGDHGFLAAVLLPGMRALTVGVDAITGTAGLIWPGDRVDLILTQVMPDNAASPGHRVLAETVLTDVRVIAIDQQLVQGAAPGTAEQTARTVTLEVNRDQAERVSVATRLGRLSLAVRSADTAHQQPDTHPQPATIWASDVSAALSHDVAPHTDHPVRVFPGSADSKEFHF